MLAPWKKSYEQPRQHIKKQRHYFANKGLSSQSYGFSSGHVWMRELDHKEGWAPKNWCFWTVVLEKILESPLNSKEIKPVNPKGNQHWLFIERKLQYFGHMMWRADSLEKTLMLREIEDRRRGPQRTRWHHWPMDMSLSRIWEIVKDREVWRAAVHGVSRCRAYLSDWITTTVGTKFCKIYFR